MADLVTCNADCGGGWAGVDAVGKPDDVALGIIVIGKLSAHTLDGYASEPVGVKHHARCLRSGQAPAGYLPGVLIIGRINPRACNE